MATILRMPSPGKTSYQARLPVAHDPDVRAKPRSSSPRAANGTPSRACSCSPSSPVSPIRCLPVCRRVSPSYYCKRHLRSVCSQLPIGSEKSGAKVRSASKPDNARIAANMNRIVRPFSLRAPSSVPTTPPTTAATPHIGSAAGRVPMLAKFVDRATMAFTKMNATDTPAVWRISARPVSKSNRLSRAALPFASPSSHRRRFTTFSHPAGWYFSAPLVSGLQ